MMMSLVGVVNRLGERYRPHSTVNTCCGSRLGRGGVVRVRSEGRGCVMHWWVWLCAVVMYTCAYYSTTLYMYVHVCMYMYVCTCMFMYVHVCKYMYVHVCMFMYVCTCMFMYVCTCTYVHVCSCMYVHVCSCMCVVTLWCALPQFIGSLEISRPSSKLDIITAMRRIRVSGVV